MLGAACLFGTMSGLVKWGGEHGSLFEVTFWRSVFGLAPVAVALRLRRVSPWPRNPGLLAARCAAGTVAMLGHFYGIVALSLSDAALLGSTAPVFVALAGPFVLGEKTSRGTWLAILACAVGITFVLRPGFDVFRFAAVAALGAGLFSAIAYLTIRKLSERDEDSDVIALWFPLVSAAVNGVLMLPTFHWPSTEEWPGFVALGVFGGGGQLLMTRAYAAGPAAPVAAASYCTVVVAWLFAIAVFREHIFVTSVVGGILVVSAGAWLAATTRGTATH